jgi:protein ImuA
MEHKMNIMPESPHRLAALRRRIDQLTQFCGNAAYARVPLGHDAVDAVLGGGLARGKLHEIVAAEADDAACATGFAAMLARRLGGALVWLRVDGTGGVLHAPGLNEIGLDPGVVLSVSTPDPPTLLRAAGDVMRCGAVGVVVIELWREPKRIDLTVSRQLILAAEISGTTALLLRIAADPVPNAAQTRWSVCAAPSSPLAANAPGLPALDIELLRQRGGPSGARWRLEWDRDQTCFRDPALPSAVVSFPARRPLDGEIEEYRRRTA